MGEVIRLPLARIHDPGGCPKRGSYDGVLTDVACTVWAFCLFDATRWPIGKAHTLETERERQKNAAALAKFQQVRPIFRKPDGVA